MIGCLPPGRQPIQKQHKIYKAMSIIKGIKVGSSDITGTYESTSTLSDTENLTVVAVNLEDAGSISSISSTTYNGSAHTPLPTVTATVGNEVVTLVKDTDYTLSYSNNTNAGQATVTVTGIGNYTGVISANWTINSAEIVVTYTDQTYQYNKTPQGSGISVSTVDEEPTIKYGLTSGTYNLTDVPHFTNVSNNTVYYKVTAPNHTDAIGSYTVNITPITAELQWGTLYWTYDGNPHSTTCTVNNLISGDICDVILSGNSITEVGSTTVTATGLSNSNYVLASDNLTAILTINPGMFIKLSGVWTPVKKVFKKISGDWVEQNVNTTFSTSEVYKKVN